MGRCKLATNSVGLVDGISNLGSGMSELRGNGGPAVVHASFSMGLDLVLGGRQALPC